MVGAQDPEYGVLPEEASHGRAWSCSPTPTSWPSRSGPTRTTTSSACCSSAEVDGEQLTELEFDMFFLLLAVAGNETTRNLISHGMLALMEHPDQYATAAQRPVAGRLGRRGDAALGHAGHALPPHRVARHRDRRPGHRRGRQGRDLVHRRPTATRRCSTTRTRFDISRATQPARGLRRRRPPLLPRRQPGPHGDPRDVRRAAHAAARHRARPATCQRLRSNFINGIKHLPVRVKPA